MLCKHTAELGQPIPGAKQILYNATFSGRLGAQAYTALEMRW